MNRRTIHRGAGQSVSFRNLARIALALSLAVLGTGLFVRASTASALGEYGPYHIRGLQSYKCIDTPHSSHADNVNPIIYTCLNQPNQAWYFEDTSDGYYQIYNGHASKCLTVLNARTVINQPIIQYECNGGTNAQWRPINKVAYTDGDYYELQNRKSGLCLHVKNADYGDGATLLQFTCNGGANSAWTWPAWGRA